MRRRVRFAVDLVALLLLASAVLFGLAICQVYAGVLSPLRATTSWVDELFEFFGVGLYGVLGLWLTIALTILLQGRWSEWSRRVVGWVILIPSLSLAADCWPHLLVGAPFKGAATGPGGLLGASLHQLLWNYLPSQLTNLVAVAGLVFGLGLAGDFFWPRLFRSLARITRRYRRYRARKKAETIAQRELERASAASGSTGAIPIRYPVLPKPVDTEASRRETIRVLENGLATTPVPPAEPPPVKRPAPLPTQTPPNQYQLPPFDLLEEPEPFPYEVHDQHLRERAVKLEKTFNDFALNVHVVGINTGPVITQYEVALETGLRLHKVTSLADDLALNLKVPSVRMVAPIPGKDTVGVEIPNEHRAVVRLKEIILNVGPKVAQYKIPLFFGKDTEGRPLVYDLADMPHLLIAGRTGTGKSVCMNAIILSILMTRRPDEVKMIMIDPKMLELSEYGNIPHLMHPVVKDMRKAEAILGWAVDKMEERYDLLSRARVRGIAGYNELSPDEIYRRVQPADDDERARTPERMPYIILFVDELNDLMMTMRKEVEGHIIRLAQKSRAAGIHLVVATQKPTVDVITGLIKSNLPARICFQVSSRSDSRVVLDEMGAEKLLGKGDMLFLQPGTSSIIRAQGAYASDREISQVVEYLACEPSYSRELIQLSTSRSAGRDSAEDNLKSRDELYEQAIDVIVREGRGSVSLLQRALGIGYGRAARLVDYMAEDGIVGPYNGSNAREVLLTIEQWEAMKERNNQITAHE